MICILQGWYCLQRLYPARPEMAPSVAIPQDIIENIIEAVGNDKGVLKQCALVSSSFLRPTRKQLFSELELTLERDKACQRLHQFLVQNPVTQSFVRSIVVTRYSSQHSKFLKWNSPLPAILRLPFSRLESFSLISPREFLDWNGFSSELKDVLSNIIHSPILKPLHLEKVISMPLTLFLGISHLTHLQLVSLLPDDFDGKQSDDEQSSSLTSAASDGVVIIAYHTVIDHCEWDVYQLEEDCTRFPTSASFSLIPYVEDPTEIFLPFMCRLRSFEISANALMRDLHILSSLMCSLRVGLTSPATLEHLKFNSSADAFDDPLNAQLFEELCSDDVWGHVDSIITHPTGSRLQRVDIHIHCKFHCDSDSLRDNCDGDSDGSWDDGYGSRANNDDIAEAILECLPLLREKGILFVEVSKGNDIIC